MKNKHISVPSLPKERTGVRYTGAFTLVEILVSISILGIILVSVTMVFIHSTRISSSSDVERIMHENIKNVMETITEDVRKNGILGVSSSVTDSCNMSVGDTGYQQGDKFCTQSGNEYYVAHRIGGEMVRIDDWGSCDEIKEHCILVQNGNPLTNSMVSVRNLSFFLSNAGVPKITFSLTLAPSYKSGLSREGEKNTIVVQTTMSQRSF